MTGALMQDQWEAFREAGWSGNGIRRLPAIPAGYVPVPPARIADRTGFAMIDVKWDDEEREIEECRVWMLSCPSPTLKEDE